MLAEEQVCLCVYVHSRDRDQVSKLSIYVSSTHTLYMYLFWSGLSIKMHGDIP